MTFTDYAAKNGCKLLPDDIKWLRSLFSNVMPKSQIQSLLKDYVALWVIAMAECNCPIKKQNLGRKAANTFIRLEIQKNGR